MAKDYAKRFYSSKRWQHTRDCYAASVGGLCERCLQENRYAPGEIVHHKTHITPENINNPEVTLSWNNLELLCRDCHKLEHAEEIYNNKNIFIIKKKRAEERKRYFVDDDGNVIIK